MSELKYVKHEDFPARLLVLLKTNPSGLALVEVATGFPKEWVGTKHWVFERDVRDVPPWEAEEYLNEQVPLWRQGQHDIRKRLRDEQQERRKG